MRWLADVVMVGDVANASDSWRMVVVWVRDPKGIFEEDIPRSSWAKSPYPQSFQLKFLWIAQIERPANSS